MLFGLKPYDPATLLFAISILALVAIAASYIPARHATGVDPMVALREE
jgi:ABC-type antimicrobial peptide transport system permease subunit